MMLAVMMLRTPSVQLSCWRHSAVVEELWGYSDSSPGYNSCKAS